MTTTTDKKAWALFLIIGHTYDLMPDVNSWMTPDKEDKTTASQMRSALIKLNDINFSHETFGSIHSICGELFEVLVGHEYNPSVTKHKLGIALGNITKEFPWLPKGMPMTEAEITNSILAITYDLGIEF